MESLKSAIAPLLLVFAAAACEPVADAVFPVQANPTEKGVRYELTGYASPDSVEDGQVYEYH